MNAWTYKIYFKLGYNGQDFQSAQILVHHKSSGRPLWTNANTNASYFRACTLCTIVENVPNATSTCFASENFPTQNACVLCFFFWSERKTSSASNAQPVVPVRRLGTVRIRKLLNLPSVHYRTPCCVPTILYRYVPYIQTDTNSSSHSSLSSLSSSRIVWPTRTGDKTPEVVMERYMWY